MGAGRGHGRTNLIRAMQAGSPKSVMPESDITTTTRATKRMDQTRQASHESPLGLWSCRARHLFFLFEGDLWAAFCLVGVLIGFSLLIIKNATNGATPIFPSACRPPLKSARKPGTPPHIKRDSTADPKAQASPLVPQPTTRRHDASQATATRPLYDDGPTQRPTPAHRIRAHGPRGL